MESNNKEVKDTLTEIVSLMLIAIKEGDMVVFQKEDNSVDYIQLLEDCNKRPLLTYVIIEKDGSVSDLDCYSVKEIDLTLEAINMLNVVIVSIKVH